MSFSRFFAGTALMVVVFGAVLAAYAQDAPTSAPSPKAKQDEPAKPEAKQGDPGAKPAAKPARVIANGKTFKLPGLTGNAEKGYVDLDAKVSRDHGYLELIACSPGTKEYESLVVINARPRHVHAALLMIGAVNGHPEMREKVGKGKHARWVSLPPRGDKIKVSLVIPDGHGGEKAFPINDFVMYQQQKDPGIPAEAPKGDQNQESDTPDTPDTFPNEFLFAGSQIVESKNGPVKYIADVSGDVITISTFGDAVLCLTGEHSSDNSELVWKVNPKMLPKVGTKVKLRLQRLNMKNKDSQRTARNQNDKPQAKPRH